MKGNILYINLREIAWDRDYPSFFDLMDEDGVSHSIPFHCAREVWRDGALVWQRHPALGKIGVNCVCSGKGSGAEVIF